MTRRYDEGIVKFELVFRPAPALPDDLLRELGAWRRILWRLGLIGQDPARYGGVGFGNVSRRLPATGGALRFAITGSQTGAVSTLGAGHYAIVTGCDPERNRIEAEGPIAPSSESLTHGMLYRLEPTIAFVFHVHSPDIWRRRAALDLPTTAPEVAYGTPAMAREVERLMRAGTLAQRRIFAMGGHEDGIVAFGRTAEKAGVALIQALARALAG